jgi:peroxiredoxin
MTERIPVGPSGNKSTMKSAIVTVVIFAAAAAGVYLGMSLRGGGSASPQPVQAEPEGAPTSKLALGSIFPDVAVFDESGAPLNTKSLVGDHGAVLLFMELGCPPCKEMSQKWQGAIESGKAAGVPLLGVTINLPVNIRPYRMKNKLTFPIYADTLNIFMDNYDVTNYPLEVVVGKSGKVTYTTFNSAEPIDFDKLKEQLEG